MQRIFAIAGLTWKAALRFKLFLVITALLLIAVIGLPLVIKDDGTAEGFTQIILTYTLSAITALLGLSTIWLSCGTLARDIEECQIQVVVTKPIARWQIWIGKWLGIVTLNAVLLLISGAFVFGLLEYRASKLPAAVQQKLHTDILVARGAAKEADMTAMIDEETAREFTARMAQSSVEKVDEAEVKKIIRAQVKAAVEQVPPGYFSRPWQIDLGFAKNSLADKPLQLRIKFNGAERTLSGTFTLMLQAGDPKSGKVWRSEPMSLAPSTESEQVFHEIPIPANLFDSSGVLTIIAYNPNNTALSFPLEDGMEVLYPDGGFAPNFARGLGIIFCWLALMAALGLMAASFLSFPVAAFFSLTMLVVVFSSGTLADAIDSGSVAAGNEETGVAGHSVMDVVLIPAFKALLSVIRLVQNFSPVDALSTGRCITWTELGLAFTQIVLVIGGIFAVMGIYFFSRRELATAQTQ
ncbi:MAG TPA: ABC transporter permease [Candidatus Sulfotelmatobacter sp.]|jgi:hypothetical protein|nr:ABC transporter permease [Candidatus Sulfotelmatobacter sp.]